MITRNQDENGKIITSGRQFIKGKDAVAIAVTRRLRTYLGECFLQIGVGVPYYEIVFTNASIMLRESAIKEQILATNGVETILAFTLYSNAKREMRCSALLLSSEGDDIAIETSIASAGSIARAKESRTDNYGRNNQFRL